MKMFPSKYEEVKVLTTLDVFHIIDEDDIYFQYDNMTYFTNNGDLTAFLSEFMEFDLSNKNRWNYSFVEYDEQSSDYFVSELATKVINGVIDRYADEVFLTYQTEKVETTLNFECWKRVNKLLNILNFTYPKYSALLALYDSEKNKLLDGVKATETEAINNSQNSMSNGGSSGQSVNKRNDTPQIKETTPSLYDTDDYVSEYNKNNDTESHNENVSIAGQIQRSKTYSNDRETKIERLAEIEKKYSQVWRAWLNEFEPLFTSEENY